MEDPIKTLIKEQMTMPLLAGVSEGQRVACPIQDCVSHYKNKVETVIYNDSWYCFICKGRGDIFNWLEHKENLNYSEARRYLADRLGISISPPKERSEYLKQVCLAAHQYLKSHSEKRKYLENRGISWKLMWRYSVGYIDVDGEVLSNCGLTEEQLLQVGLLYPEKEAGAGHVSALAGRYIFPIKDVKKRIVQLKGRADPEALPPEVCKDRKSIPLRKKPLHAPQSWGEIPHMAYLFLEDTLDEAKSENYVVINEGEPDTLTMRSLDFISVGLQTSQGIVKHAYKLKGIKTIYLMLDNDVASTKNILNELFYLQTRLPDSVVKLVKVPHLGSEGEKVDVNDLVCKYGWNRKQVKDLLSEALPATSVLIDTWGKEYNNKKVREMLFALISIYPSDVKEELITRLSKVTKRKKELLKFALDPELFEDES